MRFVSLLKPNMSTSRSKRSFHCANKRATNHAEARRLQAVCENCDMSHQTRILDGGTNLLHSETGIWSRPNTIHSKLVEMRSSVKPVWA
ncbi:hypothetical protein TNCV_3155151 [Trichonephila clavipes]|nr:hypothetical protein TNCV_3155151 [Trichonephila clavipes]